jgi:hypothetical protein
MILDLLDYYFFFELILFMMLAIVLLFNYFLYWPLRELVLRSLMRKDFDEL